MFEIEADNLATFGATTIRVRKGGMSYTFNNADAGIEAGDVFEVPVITLRVFGISADCSIGIIQTNWVYNSAAVPGGVQQLYPVFDNGANYTARLSKAGFSNIDSAAAQRTVYDGNEELWIYFNNFYQIEIPAGVTNVRMQSNNWIVNPANAGDKIALLVDYNAVKAAKMNFEYNGKAFTNVEFMLDGSDPFSKPFEVNIVVEPTCTLEGYTITYLNLATGEGWYANYVPALGHTHADPVWDGWGWYIVCDVCGWAGYIEWQAEWVTTVVDPTCTLQGYTEKHHVPTGGKWYSDYTAALGHEYDEEVWDGWGWYIVCDKCGWAGYTSYVK